MKGLIEKIQALPKGHPVDYWDSINEGHAPTMLTTDELKALATSLSTAVEALEKWKCSICRGTGRTFNSMDEPVDCGCFTGLEPVASSALAEIRSLIGKGK